MSLNQVGDEHVPPNEERANQLVKLGFIKSVEEEKEKKEEIKEKKKSTKKKKVDEE